MSDKSSVQIGTHLNGQRFAKVWLSDRGITATIEGCGADDDAAVDDLRMQLQMLSEMASDAANAMAVEVGE